MLFVCYPKCSTCGKARAWLENNGLEFTERDIKTDNPTADELRAWHENSGLPWKRFSTPAASSIAAWAFPARSIPWARTR